MSEITDVQKLERIQVDCEFAKKYITKVGYITKEIASGIGIIDYEGVMRLLDDQVSLEWMRAVAGNGDEICMLYYSDHMACTHCGLFTVYSLDSGDCDSCRSFQAGVGESTRACASQHADLSLPGFVDVTYGTFQEIKWIDSCAVAGDCN